MRPLLLGLIGLFMVALLTVPASGQDNGSQFARYLNYVDHPDSLGAISVESLLEQGKDSDSVTQAWYFKLVAWHYLKNSDDPEMAMEYLMQAYVREVALNFKPGLLTTHLILAGIFETIGNSEKALEAILAAKQFAGTDSDERSLRFCLLEAGRLQVLLRKQEAVQFLNQARLESEQSDDQPLIGMACFQLGEFYSFRNKFDSALQNYRRAITIFRSLNDLPRAQAAYYAAGNLYAGAENETSAKANFDIALSISENGGPRELVPSVYNSIGDLYYKSKKYKEAAGYFQSAMTSARQTNQYRELLTAYDYLSLCYAGIGDFKQALEFRNLFVALNDFITRDQSEREVMARHLTQIQAMSTRRIEELVTTTEVQAEQLLLERKVKSSLHIILVLAAVILLLTVYLYLSKRKTAKMLKVANDLEIQKSLQLAELNNTKDKFFGIIGHDLKGPLNSLTSFSSLLMNHSEHLSKEEISMLARDLDKSLRNLFVLLENLLEWARAQTGAIEIIPEKLGLAAMAQENINLLNQQAQVKNIQLSSTIPDTLFVHAHPLSVKTVIRNLISNAIKFTNPGGSVTLGAQPSGAEVIVTITDTGVGIPPEVVNNLFRIDKKHSTIGTAQEKGTGLGLILCADFVSRNGGKIWVKSKPGTGTTFFFTLPHEKS